MAKGFKTGGRKPNTPNKVTVAVKEAIESVFEGIGGVEAMVTWAREKPDLYYPLFVRLLPKDVNITGSVAVSLCDALKELPEK